MMQGRSQRVAIMIIVEVILITLVMYIGEGRWAAAPALRYLYLLPIAQAALWFGLTGSMAVALAADLLFVPIFATALGRFGLGGGPTVEIGMTLILMPLLAYFAGNGWGRLRRQQQLYRFLSGMGDLFGRFLDRDALLDQILTQGTQLIDAEGGEIVLLEDDQAVIAAHFGFPASAPLPYERSLARMIIEHGAVWRSVGLDYDALLVRHDQGPPIDSVVAVPLRISGEPVGVLAFYNRRGGFGKHEEAAVVAMGSKVEVALENDRQIEQRHEQERLLHEFTLAAEVQHRLLPASMPAIPGYQVAARTLAAREIGGDFYLFAPLADGRWCVALGDVSGKGVVGAFFMAIATSLLDLALHKGGDEELLATLNPLFHARMAPQKLNTALAYAILDPTTGDALVGNAGLIAPLVVRGDDCRFLDVAGFPLGAWAAARYQPLTTSLAPGEMLVFVSDGVVEAASAERELFGLETLQNLIAAQGTCDPEALADAILSAAQAWGAEGDIEDDMTVLVLRREPLATA